MYSIFYSWVQKAFFPDKMRRITIYNSLFLFTAFGLLYLMQPWRPWLVVPKLSITSSEGCSSKNKSG